MAYMYMKWLLDCGLALTLRRVHILYKICADAHCSLRGRIVYCAMYLPIVRICKLTVCSHYLYIHIIFSNKYVVHRNLMQNLFNNCNKSILRTRQYHMVVEDIAFFCCVRAMWNQDFILTAKMIYFVYNLYTMGHHLIEWQIFTGKSYHIHTAMTRPQKWS